MNAPSICAVPPAAYTELLDYLRQSGSTLSPAEAIVSALKQWIAAGRTLAAPVRGYQWKCLFLPEATRVRMKYRDDYHHAEVVGDELNAALMLIEHVDHQTKTMSERRLPKHRRADDTLTDDH